MIRNTRHAIFERKWNLLYVKVGCHSQCLNGGNSHTGLHFVLSDSSPDNDCVMQRIPVWLISQANHMLSQSHIIFLTMTTNLYIQYWHIHTHIHIITTYLSHYDSFWQFYETVLVSPNVAVTQSRLKILVMKASTKPHVYKIAACAQKQIMRTRTRGQQTTPTKQWRLTYTWQTVRDREITRNDNVVSPKTKFKRHILEEFHGY